MDAASELCFTNDLDRKPVAGSDRGGPAQYSTQDVRLLRAASLARVGCRLKQQCP